MPAPRKIYVEVTTHCNLQCSMCVKHAQGSCIPEEHMPMEVFQQLARDLKQVEFLVLNGIGEPLLHPGFIEMVRTARQHMPESGIIGFQSNGLLLTREKVEELMASGIDTICLSLDSLEDVGRGLQGRQHSLPPVSRAVERIRQERKKSVRPFQLGIELVISKANMHQLPDVVSWAAENGVDYILVSHLYSYDGLGAESVLFSPSSKNAVRLYRKWWEKGQECGLDLQDLPRVRLKYNHTDQEKRLLQLGAEMRRDAGEQGIRVHLQNLFNFDAEQERALEKLYDQVEHIAASSGIALYLPPRFALEEEERHCFFMDEAATFVDTRGNVAPCHFLWHTFRCQVNDEPVQVERRSFGNVCEESLEKIWQKQVYSSFRQEAGLARYSSCWSCTPGPCAGLLKHNAMDIRDCHGSQVPCGHCMWPLGWTRCL